MNYHNSNGEAGSCTRCAAVHASDDEMYELNAPLYKEYWTPYPGDAGDETDDK